MTSRGRGVDSHYMFLTVAGVARRLKCSRNTVYRLIERGELPRVKVGPKTTRIPDEAVDAFIARNTVTEVAS